MQQRVGEFELLAPLGAGAMAEVLLARRRGEGLVALKCLRPAHARDPELLGAFRGEAEMLAQLKDPHIVRFVASGIDHGTHYLALEYVPGTSLARVLDGLRQGGRYASFEAVAAVGDALLAALVATHEAVDAQGKPLGLVHADVSPHNLVLGEGGTCKLTDFGGARFATGRCGTVGGNLPYLSPEELESGTVDHRADLWAAAMVIYELLTGVQPMAGVTELDSLRNIRRRRVRKAKVHRPETPGALVEVLATALSAKPERRFHTARAFRSALAAAVPLADHRTALRRLLADAGVHSARVARPLAWQSPEGGAHRAVTSSTRAERRRRRVRWLTVALVAVLSLVAARAFAQPVEAAGGAAESDEVDSAEVNELRTGAVVTASGSEESLALAAANVTSVGWEEIARRRYRSLGEILADVPGLYVLDDLVLPSVGVRGVTGGLRAGTRIVKVMVNGVPVNFRPELTAFLGPEFMPVQMIERVEVAKGPLSALYGANAFVATVNIITRGQSGASLVLEAATRLIVRRNFAGYGGSLIGGYNEESRSLFVAVTAERMDRSGLAVRPTFAEQDPELARYRPFFSGASTGDTTQPRSLYGQYTQKTPLGTLSLQGGIQQLDAMGEFQLNSVLTHRTRIALENDWLSARLENKWSPQTSGAAWLGWSRGAPLGEEELFLTGTDDVSFARRFGYQALDGGGELSWSNNTLSLKAGVDFSYEPHDVLFYTQTLYSPQGTLQPGDTIDVIGADDQSRVTLGNVGAYGLTTLALGDLRLTANARLDVPTLFPPQLSWRAVAAHRWTETLTTKLIIGQAFQTPSATLLFGLPGFGSSNNVIGNRTLSNTLPLNPQRVQSVELATSAQLFGRMVVDAAVYGQRVSDKIEFVQLGSNFLARNQGEQLGVGAEGSLRLRFGPATLGGQAEIVRKVEEGLIQPSAHPLFPAYRFSADLALSVPQWRLYAQLRVSHVGPRGASQSNVYLNNDTPYELPAFTSVDLTLATLGLNFLGGAQTALSLTVKNLFDERHSEPGFGGMDVPSLGRVAVIELRQSY